MLYKEMPKDTRRSATTDVDVEDTEEKQFRAESISLNMGGFEAKEDQYIGTSFVPMRIVNRITKPGGVLKNAFSLDGFIPETGHPAIMFFDTRLRQGTKPEDRDYVRNWGGGLAIEMAIAATEEEAQELLDEINAENGTEFQYDWREWSPVGGLLKLKPSKVGKPVVIGKQYKKIKAGKKMNIFKCTPLDPREFPHLQEDIDNWEALRGVPYDPEEEGLYSPSESSDDEEGSDSEEEVEEYIPEPEPVPAKAPANNRRPVTRTRQSREDAAQDVAKEFNKPVANPVVETKKVLIPESVEAYIKEGYAQQFSTDQIVLGLITEHGLKERDAVDYIEAYLDKQEKGRSPKITRPVKTASAKPVKAQESEIVQVARQCKEKGMDSPETFDVLQKKFPNVSRDDKRAALKTAGLIKF